MMNNVKRMNGTELTMTTGGSLPVCSTTPDTGYDVSELFPEEEATSAFFKNDSFCGITTY